MEVEHDDEALLNESGSEEEVVSNEEEKVEDVIATIRTYASKRKQAVPNLTAFPGDTLTMPMEVMVGGATIFVTDVARFEKF